MSLVCESADLISFIVIMAIGVYLFSFYKMHIFVKMHGKDIEWSAFYMTALIPEYYALTLQRDGKCGVWLKTFFGSIIVPILLIPVIVLGCKLLK